MEIVKSKAFKNENTNVEWTYFNDELTIGSKKVANKLNSYFDTKIRNIINNIPEGKNDPMINYRKNVNKPKIKMNLKEVNYHNIKTIISKMKPYNSACRDRITSTMLKKEKQSIIPLILGGGITGVYILQKVHLFTINLYQDQLQ